MTTHSLFPTAVQMAAARTLLGLTQQEVAEGSGVALSTVKRVEQARNAEEGFANLRITSLKRLLAFYQSRGITFTFGAHSIGVSLEMTPLAPE
ncbi:MAG: hypothetical protein RLZ26_276 [Pseudomonadota bacterium]|jgi:transcriptional regulator with XRE-family HTH domain